MRSGNEASQNCSAQAKPAKPRRVCCCTFALGIAELERSVMVERVRSEMAAARRAGTTADDRREFGGVIKLEISASRF